MNQYITVRQATMWFIMYQIGSAILVLPSVLAAEAKQDAWLSVPIAVGLHMLWVPVYIAIANQFKGTSFGGHLRVVLGKWGGGGGLFGFILSVPFLICIMSLRNLGDFVTTSLLPETPVEAIYALMLITVFFVVRSGAAVIGRSVEILFFVVILIFVVVAFSLLPSAKLDNILPVFEYGWKPIVRASFPLFSFPYLESVLFLFFVSHFKNPHNWKTAVIKSSLVSGTLFFVATFITLAVLSEGVTADVMFPSYFVTRTISLGDFYERFEVIVSVLYFITLFFRLSLLMYVSAHGLAEVFRLQDGNSLLIPLLLIALVMANMIWPNVTFSLDFLQIWPFYAMVFGIIFPVFIWLMGWLKSSRNNSL